MQNASFEKVRKFPVQDATKPSLTLNSHRKALATEIGGHFSSECTDLVRQLLNYKCARVGGGDASVMRLVFTRRWWGILSMATQRAVSLNLQGGSWAPVLGLTQPCEEELLCGVVCPSHESRMR